jgi:uncharacterized protein
MKFASALALLLLLGTAQAASFPCDKARSAIEKAICADADVSALDEHLGQYYSAARSVLKSAASCLASDQRNWLRTQRDACKDAACLRQAYLQRLAELDPLQPGATRIRYLELPRVKALAWIVPPADATPINEAKPLLAQGVILNEISGGDGFVLRANDGKRLLIVPLMFLESPAVEILDSLAKEGGEYELRGYAEHSSDGSAHFAPSRCIFVYRPAR